MDFSVITATDLQHEIIGPIIIEEYKEQVTKRMKDEQYMLILAIYIDSIFQNFESFLRLEVGPVEDDFRLVLEEYTSSFSTYEIDPGIYTSKDISEVLLEILQSEYDGYHNAIDNEFYDITIESKLVVRPGIIAKNFDEKSFFSTVLGFTPGWDYTHHNECTSQKIVNLSSTNKIHLKCDVIDGSVVNGLRQPIIYSFVLDKPSGYKYFASLKRFILKT